MSLCKSLRGIEPRTYEHPLDRQALDALEKTGGLRTFVAKVNEWGLERMLRMQLTGSHLRITPDADPQLHGLLTDAARSLDLPVLPDLYVATLTGINAFTSGVVSPVVVIASEAIDLLTPAELRFVIGHELGHIKSAHVPYYQIADFVPVVGEIVGGITLGLGELASSGLQIAMLNWRRMSELTADRAGLLACQDANVALTVLMKMAGLPRSRYESANTEDFIAQARAFEVMDREALNWVARRLSVMGSTHPWTVLRAHELLKWIDDGSYDKVIAADHGASLPTAGQAFCGGCGARLNADDLFCSGCGARLRPALIA